MDHKRVSRTQVFHDGCRRSEVTGEMKYLLRKLQFYSLFCQAITVRPFRAQTIDFTPSLQTGLPKVGDASSQDNKFAQTRRCFVQ